MSVSEIAKTNVLRLAACTTTDTITRKMCLDELEETYDQAMGELNKTCWRGTPDQILKAVIEQYKG